MPYSGLPIKAAAEICSRTRLYFWGLAARGCVLDMSPFLNSGGGPPATVRRGGRWKRGHGNAPGRRLPGERAPPPRPPPFDTESRQNGGRRRTGGGKERSVSRRARRRPPRRSPARSEERRVGKADVRTGRFRLSPDP